MQRYSIVKAVTAIVTLLGGTTMRRRSSLWKTLYLKSIIGLIAMLFILSACGGSLLQQTARHNTAHDTNQDWYFIIAFWRLLSRWQAFQQGYNLWADTVNKNGGILGRKVQLDILSDASSTTQIVTNYQKLITVDHCDLVFGPFSTLLTKAGSVVANRYGYAFLEGAGGGPSVFTQGLHNVFDVSAPVANLLVSFTQYLLSLPPAQRPTTAAYATQDDPFTQPQVDTARQLLEQGGVKTASYQVYPVRDH